ncbi:PadR family transcriptional regulator [Arthrobacter sp. H35-D1]|uniref:PadR family transcriptional regulator n=1 Tax=Arthrobacter sp. H35-D1 TaxID=3046202 RepID=UPI0024BABD43|nr:PadR family transcriptional regulator [Arthrobacter sp. H35-D1]MDJ0315282.1 PadR family transcriptional regulator [Arthrobacter sp. H35-D1]
MSIKHSLLALLQESPRYGYQLRGEFEERTGATWPLNIGQVYTTLDRLERDALVQKDGDDGEGHVVYSITDAGRAEVMGWFAAPVVASNPPRNELAIKLALALTLTDVDVSAVVQAQRTASMRLLQDYTRQRRTAASNAGVQLSGDPGAGDPKDAAWLLVLDSLIFSTEAEVRWLDHCEGWMAKRAASRTKVGPRSVAGLAEPPTARAAKVSKAVSE